MSRLVRFSRAASTDEASRRKFKKMLDWPKPAGQPKVIPVKPPMNIDGREETFKLMKRIYFR
jgi:hypothetical protein